MIDLISGEDAHEDGRKCRSYCSEDVQNSNGYVSDSCGVQLSLVDADDGELHGNHEPEDEDEDQLDVDDVAVVAILRCNQKDEDAADDGGDA